MFSADSFPEVVVKFWAMAQRFQKFLVVGALGFLTNQGFLWFFHSRLNWSVGAASPIAILISMAVTFYLNEIWTWHDRVGGRLLTRAQSYVPINIGGLAINWAILFYLHDHFSVHYLIANLVGAGVAAVWNFVLNNWITWRT